MPELSTQDLIEIDAVCNGLTLKQEVAYKIIETCELKQGKIPYGFVEDMCRQLEDVFTNNGDNNAEQA